MTRPRLKYVIINERIAENVIYDGLENAARRVAHLRAYEFSACHLSFKSQLAAEEFICWWQYEKEVEGLPTTLRASAPI